MLDDSFLGDDFQHLVSNQDAIGETTDEDDDNDERKYCKTGHGYKRGLRYKNGYYYGSDIDSDDDTYEYSEIADDFDDEKHGYGGGGHNSSEDGNHRGYREKKDCKESTILGGRNVLQSFEQATSLELLTDAQEVQISPSFADAYIFHHTSVSRLYIYILNHFFAYQIVFNFLPKKHTLFLS
jgi:hypothetical protein